VSKHARKHSSRRDDGWYEVMDTAVDAKLIPRSVKETDGHRCFVRGPVGQIEIIEVPESMPEVARQALGQRLSSMGATVLLVNEHIKFYRLRRASAEEKRSLDAFEKQDGEAPASPSPGDEAADGAVSGSVTHGDGRGGDQPDGGAGALGDDQERAQGGIKDR